MAGEQINKLEWNESLSVGHELLDQQHQNFFVAVNELIDFVEGSQDEAQAFNIIARIAESSKSHFETEEEILADLSPSMLKSQQAQHREFSERLAQMLGNVPLDVLVEFITEWIYSHVLDEDLELRGLF